jgi:Trypsin-co-occurring domain 1
MPGGRVISVQVGDTEVLVQTVPVAGTEPTAGRAQQALERAGEAFCRAQEVIVEVAKSTAEVIEKAAARAARPDHVEIEFGLSFSVSGGVIMVAGAAGEATLRVLLSYDARQPVPSGEALGSALQPAAPAAGTA